MHDSGPRIPQQRYGNKHYNFIEVGVDKTIPASVPLHPKSSLLTSPLALQEWAGGKNRNAQRFKPQKLEAKMAQREDAVQACMYTVRHQSLVLHSKATRLATTSFEPRPDPP